MRARTGTVIFVVIGIFLISCGTVLMLNRVLGERLESGGSIQLVTGFSAVAVGAMLLTRHSLAVFFYFCFVLAIAAVQLPMAGLRSLDAFIVLAMLALGGLLIRALPKKKRRR